MNKSDTEAEKEKRIKRNENILIPLAVIISATTGFILRGRIDETYFRQQEPPKRQITEPQPDTRPYENNNFPEYETYLS